MQAISGALITSFQKTLALCAILVALGCGGSSDSGPAGPPVAPATSMRSNVPGDAWTYSVTATLPYAGTGSGTLTNSLTSDTYAGQQTVRWTEDFEIQYPSQTITLAASNELSLTGQLLAVTSMGQYSSVVKDTFHLGSTIGPTTDVKGGFTLADGTSVTEEYKVTGKARVTVKAGTFDCWIITETESRNDGTKDYFTLYLAPEIGGWVKARARTNYSGGQVFSWSAELTALSLPPATTKARASATPTILVEPTLRP